MTIDKWIMIHQLETSLIDYNYPTGPTVVSALNFIILFIHNNNVIIWDVAFSWNFKFCNGRMKILIKIIEMLLSCSEYQVNFIVLYRKLSLKRVSNCYSKTPLQNCFIQSHKLFLPSIGPTMYYCRIDTKWLVGSSPIILFLGR